MTDRYLGVADSQRHHTLLYYYRASSYRQDSRRCGLRTCQNREGCHVRVSKIRRRIVRVARHGGRDLARWRPTPVVGALLVGAVLGLGVTGAVAAVSGPD